MTDTHSSPEAQPLLAEALEYLRRNLIERGIPERLIDHSIAEGVALARAGSKSTVFSALTHATEIAKAMCSPQEAAAIEAKVMVDRQLLEAIYVMLRCR